MIKPLNRLLITQFLSALADNMILMATIHVITAKALGNVYVGIVQAAFFVAYILLAPYAGVLSERVHKSSVLWIGNVLKLIGAILLSFGLDPALSYAIVGIGACLYSPGKYGILKELTNNENDLYKANGMVEGSTIVAILLGTVLGGFLSTHSFPLAMTVIMAFYGLSFLFAWVLPKGSVTNVSFSSAWKSFGQDISVLWRIPQAKSSLIGTSSFWMISSVLRLAMIAWIPIALHLSGEDKASLFMGVSAIGIMIGAITSPKIIPLARLKRLALLGTGMAVAIGFVGFLPQMILTGAILFVAGFLGGVYVIPLNTILQERGQPVGTGKTIAIQNFFENIMMLTGTLIYTGALHIGIDIPLILVFFAVIFVIVVYYVRTAFKKNQA